MEKVAVSVIIPNYNHTSFLKQRIESVLNQTYQDFELIILDDCSTDNSSEIIETYRNNPRISHIVYNDQNSGSPFKQWKKGIELSRGEYIWIAESDDWCDINFLNTLTEKLSDKTVSLAYCRTISVGESERQNLYEWGEAIEPELWKSDHNFKGNEFIASFLKYRNVIPNASAVLFRKKYFTDVDEVLKMCYAGDWFLWICIAAKGNVAYSCKPLNYFRCHQASTRSIKEFEEELMRIQEYYKSIMKACSITSSPFRSLTKHYNWILVEWMERVDIFGIKKSLLSPYPILFKFKAHSKLLAVKFKNLIYST